MRLEEAGCFSRPSVASRRDKIRFRDRQGHTWDGFSNRPDLLQRAVNARQSIAHFQVED